MNRQEKINKLVNEALHSLVNVTQAKGKPYLLTRIKAKMQAQKPSVWDVMLAFISKPTVAIACVVAIVVINVAVLASNTYNVNAEDNYAITDVYNTGSMAINEIENIEP